MELQAVRAEIEHMRRQVLRQRREIQDLQKAGIAEQIGELALDVTERLQAVEPLAIAPTVARPPQRVMVGLWGAGPASFCFRLQPQLYTPAAQISLRCRASAIKPL